MIQCKRVYDAPAREDGYRILVDRLWPRGIKKADLVYDEWCKALTPSSELRKAYHGDTLDFAAFGQAYRQELAQHKAEGERIAARAQTQTVTLLYAAKQTEQNHAQVLAAWLRQLAVSRS